jgi:hypothetical protein
LLPTGHQEHQAVISQLNKLVARIQVIDKQPHLLNQDDGQRLMTHFKAFDELLHPNRDKGKLDEAAKKRLESDIEKHLEVLKYYIDHADFVDVDPNARKRIVVASISSPQASPVSDFVDYQELRLIDFLYYPLTTFGDIIPTSPYAKFLSCFSKIVDLFFLVVFFNALLAVKRSKRKENVHRFAAFGGTGRITMATRDPISVVTTDYPQWIKLGDRSGGDGTIDVPFSIDPYSETGLRTGKISIRNQDVHEEVYIRQDGLACSIQVSPRVESITPDGGGGTIEIRAPEFCSWRVRSKPRWISTTPSTKKEMRGNGSVLYKVEQNSSGEVRTGRILIGDQAVVINQEK